MSKKKSQATAPADAPLSFDPKELSANVVDRAHQRLDQHARVLDLLVRELGLRDQLAALAEHDGPAAVEPTDDDDDA